MRLDITPALAAKARRVNRNAVAVSIGTLTIRLTADAVQALAKLIEPPTCPTCGEPMYVDSDGPICTVCPIPFVIGPAVQRFRPSA